jgi:hypothetical protein
MGAPKGNTNAAGNNGGRPLAFESVEQIQRDCSSYLKEREEKQLIPTMTGLARSLGISRITLWKYGQGEMTTEVEFINALKPFLSIVAEAWETRLGGANSAGAAFWLKNHGWVDRTETKVEHSGQVTQVTESTEEVLKKVNEQLKSERTANIH